MELKEIIVVAISSLALFVSIINFWLSYKQRSNENHRGIRKSLSEILGELTEVSITRHKLDIEYPDSTDKIVVLRRMYNSQRRYLASHAEYLADQIPKLITDIDYNLLAGAYHAIGDYSKTQHYWELCVEKSPSNVIRALNLRGYARFLFALKHVDMGRQKFVEALNLLKPDTDPSLRERADTYAMWSKIEYDFGFEADSISRKLQALAEANKINNAGMRNEITAYITDLLSPIS
jgi:tetratricopeptide (TPR) repeat protein